MHQDDDDGLWLAMVLGALLGLLLNRMFGSNLGLFFQAFLKS